MAPDTRLVYFVPGTGPVGNATLGGKGESLVRIAKLGLPVPPAFIISTEACRLYLAEGALPNEVWGEIEAGVDALEDEAGRQFGDPANPLLVSVRSGAVASMPGMMDTLLNVGLTRATLPGLARTLGDVGAASDAYARLVDTYRELIGGEPPEDPRRQLQEAVTAVFQSWNAVRAVRFRRFAGIDDFGGTAAIVQAMVFGNLQESSGTGVAFTRNPATGDRGLYGEFLAQAQGDDVVGGTHDGGDLRELQRTAPGAAAALAGAAAALEASYADLCDIEFTVERGRLWILQARPGARSAQASIAIALDLVSEGMIGWDEAFRRIPPEAFVRILEPVFEPGGPRTVIGRGIPASPGAAVGHAALTPLAAEERAQNGEDVILIRPSTSPWDIAGMIVARGVITAHGGRTSHAAVVARGMSRPAVCGVGGLLVGETTAEFASVHVREGELISLDGARGEVYAGALSLVAPVLDPRVETLLCLADTRRRVPLLALGSSAPWADSELDPDLPVVRSVDDLAGLAGAQDVVIAPEDADLARGLVARAVATPGLRLVFRVPDVWPASLRELPPGPWAAIAAGEQGRLAGRFLAAQVDVEIRP